MDSAPRTVARHCFSIPVQVGGTMSVQSEPGHGSCFEFEWTAQVAPTAPGSVDSGSRSLTLPEPSLIGSLGRTSTSFEEVEREASGQLGTAASTGGAPTAQVAGAASATTVHGFTAEECFLLSHSRVLHIGEMTTTVRGWKRVADFYGVRVDFCLTAAEARHILQACLRDASNSTPSPTRCHLDTQLPTVVVDLDSGVTEQECAAQLYTLAPMRILFLTSSKKGKAELSSESQQPTSSTPAIVPTSPTIGADARPVPAQQDEEWVAPSETAAGHQLYYPRLRRSLAKPIKLRTLVRYTLELALEPLASVFSPCDDRGSESAGSLHMYDESDWSASRSSSSRRESVSSMSSSGCWSPSRSFSTPRSMATPAQFAVPPTASSRPPKIVNVAHRFPLRSVGG